MKKRAELERILSPLGVRILTAEQAGISLREVEETGTTFEENARLKAISGCEDSNMPCVADDSGLCVDYLDGAPGVFSARYGGEHGDDVANNRLLLKNLDGVPLEKRTARFVSAVCCVFPDGRELTVKGECEGTIAFEIHGNGGFGYDPLFLVGSKTFGEFEPQEKDRLSHRGNALRKLAAELPKYL